MIDDAILALAYLTAICALLFVLGLFAEIVMDVRRRRGGAISKMAEAAARGVRPPFDMPYKRSWLTKEEIRMALSPSGPLAKDIAKCQKCGCEIVFLQSFNQRTKKRGRMPVNLRPTTPKFRPPNAGEIDFIYGQHEPHWGTCPEAEYFKGRGRRESDEYERGR